MPAAYPALKAFRTCAGLIQAVIFEVNDRDLIGYPTPAGYRYCCTKELVPKTKCFQDRLIYQVILLHSRPFQHESCRRPHAAKSPSHPLQTLPSFLAGGVKAEVALPHFSINFYHIKLSDWSLQQPV